MSVSETTIDNAHIARVLGYLYDHMRVQHILEGDNKHIFRMRHVKNARDHIENMDTSLIKSSQLDNVPGIGNGIKNRITEIIKTGTLKELQNNNSRGILELLEVYGLGVVKISELISKGITCLAALRTAIDCQRVKLGTSTLIALKYHDDITQRIPHEFIQRIDRYLADNIPETYEYVICGSYRRRKSTSGDIDVLVRNKQGSNLIDLCKQLTDKGFLKARLAGGNSSYQGICEFEGRYCRIDFLLTGEHEYYPAIIHFTGSGPFNARMRSHAIKMGYKLSNRGLLSNDTGEYISTSNEREVFDIISFPYIEPHLR